MQQFLTGHQAGGLPHEHPAFAVEGAVEGVPAHPVGNAGLQFGADRHAVGQRQGEGDRRVGLVAAEPERVVAALDEQVGRRAVLVRDGLMHPQAEVGQEVPREPERVAGLRGRERPRAAEMVLQDDRHRAAQPGGLAPPDRIKSFLVALGDRRQVDRRRPVAARLRHRANATGAEHRVMAQRPGVSRRAQRQVTGQRRVDGDAQPPQDSPVRAGDRPVEKDPDPFVEQLQEPRHDRLVDPREEAEQQAGSQRLRRHG